MNPTPPDAPETPVAPWTRSILDAVQSLLSGARASVTEPGRGDHTGSTEPPVAGATLHVTDPAGALVYSSPLARMWRLDAEDPAVLWIRPIAGRGELDHRGALVEFSLSAARRRSLAATAVHLEHEHDTAPVITAELRNGQRATIRAAHSAQELALLEEWDTFTLTALTAEEEAVLEELVEDSWHGRYA
ncbi:MAG: hypothetical protein DLM61_19535 [Pseudonocardiales bacterium]|nr:MAG: hypothetical protein DLM61_19535 [Pseudonocardiales bacterium]